MVEESTDAFERSSDVGKFLGEERHRNDGTERCSGDHDGGEPGPALPIPIATGDGPIAGRHLFARSKILLITGNDDGDVAVDALPGIHAFWA